MTVLADTFYYRVGMRRTLTDTRQWHRNACRQVFRLGLRQQQSGSNLLHGECKCLLLIGDGSGDLGLRQCGTVHGHCQHRQNRQQQQGKYQCGSLMLN